jgi:ribonuclease HI
MRDDDFYEVEGLERQLLERQTRSSRRRLDEMISDDFVEIGRSGRKWTKAEIIDSLVQETGFEVEINFVQFQRIGKDSILVTYRTKRVDCHESMEAFRSSIWQRRDQSWKIIFHQGTPIQA